MGAVANLLVPKQKPIQQAPAPIIKEIEKPVPKKEESKQTAPRLAIQKKDPKRRTGVLALRTDVGGVSGGSGINIPK